MNTGTNESKISTKHISCEFKWKFDGRKCNWYQKWNNDKCWCECKKHHISEKVYIWNPLTGSCKNGKYIASIIDDSVNTCDKTKEETKKVWRNFSEKKKLVKHKKCLYFTWIFINYYSIIDCC